MPKGDGRFLDGFSWSSPAPPRYGHLAAFHRSAPPEQVRRTSLQSPRRPSFYIFLFQIDFFWQMVASEALRELRGCRSGGLWLSTAGQGVAWLHFRIEGAPKYYSYGRYRDEELGFEEGEA